MTAAAQLAQIVRAARNRLFGCAPHGTAGCSICRIDAEARAESCREVASILRIDGWKA